MNKNHNSSTSGFKRKVLFITGVLWLVLLTAVNAQTFTYTGVVADKQGETLPGVNIMIKGTSIGTTTNIDGAFTLASFNAQEVLVFTYIGKIKQEVAATAGIPLNVVLEDEAVDIESVVVVGYGTQKKSVVTGSISSVKSSDLENAHIPRIEVALQGRTSGLTIASSSGQPGAASTVRIRGTTSLTSSDPLYVIDGVPIDVGGIDYLNSADIESIEVLKDAASAAIYGARAASGVILISTKKGSSGKMQINLNTYIGTQAPAKKLELLNATQYATLQNEASINAGENELYPNPESYGKGTDWQSLIFNNHAGIQNHELSISGGNEKSTFYTSFGYLDQEGIVASSISNYKRINLRVNSAHKLNNWFRFGNNIGYSHIKSQGSLNTNSEFGGPLASAINLDPITLEIITDPLEANSPPYSNHEVVRDANGNPYGISQAVVQEMSNPLAYIKTRQGNYGWSNNFVGDVYGEIEPISGLKIKSDLGAKLAFWGDESFTPYYYLNAATEVKKNNFYRSNNQGFIWNIENTVSYTRKFGDHNISGLVGASAFVESAYGINAKYNNLPVNTFAKASMRYSIVDKQKIAGGWENTDHKVNSIFARLTYNYSERYLFTGILRRDGSSRFGSNNKYGLFPSVSIGWVASRETFWPTNDIVNFFKIRGSYGVTGSDNIGDFRYESLVSGGRNYTFGYDLEDGEDNYVVGYSPDAAGNPDLKWEQTIQSNFGFEATILSNITVVFDLYRKSTTGMLGDLILPAYVGSGNPTANVGSMTNKGIEIELGYRKQLGDLYLDVKGNVSYLKNEVTDLGSLEFSTGASFQSSSYEISRNIVGYPIGSFYGFKTLGIFKKQSEILNYKNSTGIVIQPNAEPGDFKFADLNDDGKITSDDRTVIGDPTPTWSFGITAQANYKGFDILVFGQGVAGNEIFNGLRRLDIQGSNWTTEVLDRWTINNPFSNFPRLVSDDPNRNFKNPSSFHLKNGSYFRIKTLQIGYTLAKGLLEKIKVEKIRVYVSSNNLITFTKYNGYDPEIGGGSYSIDRGIYPQARSYMIGLNITY